nr:recombinase family protein [Actinomycetospora chiangmaiensis]
MVGYARVSTDDQNLDAQRDALHAAGWSRVDARDQAERSDAALRPVIAMLRSCRKLARPSSRDAGKSGGVAELRRVRDIVVPVVDVDEAWLDQVETAEERANLWAVAEEGRCGAAAVELDQRPDVRGEVGVVVVVAAWLIARKLPGTRTRR